MEKDILETKGMRLTEENVFYFSIRYKRIMAAKFTAYQEWVFISTGCCCSCTDSPNTLWLPQLSDMLCRRGERSMVSLTNFNMGWDETESSRREVGLGCLLCSPHVIITSSKKEAVPCAGEMCGKSASAPSTWDRCPDWSSSPFVSYFSLFCLLTMSLACSLLPAISTTETWFSPDVYNVRLTTRKSPCKILYSSWLSYVDTCCEKLESINRMCTESGDNRDTIKSHTWFVSMTG